MALPPHTIRIKRRRNEDPVQTLLVESKRRRVDGEFCFILHDTVETATSGTASPLPPNGLKPQQLTVPGSFKEGSTRPDDALRDALQSGGLNETTSSDREDDHEEDMEYDSMEEQQKPRARKKPQTHAKEKAMLQRQRSRDASRTRNAAKEEKPLDKSTEGLEFGFDSDELAKQLQDMVLDYISNQPDLDNYPANPKSPVQEKKSKVINPLGGGVGGGTWADVEKRMDVDVAGDVMKLDSDGEEGEWVYDVYFRQEIKKSKDGSTAVTNGDYGVLVISNSDDEQWWYENDEDEESASDVWGSDDEDSNAEEYYKNDYPDEDDYDAADSDNDYDRVKQYTQPRIRGRKKRGVWDYESDGSYDLEREDESD
ncbi:hypothetical protein TWF191_006404 [Orbilia oligospora]|uniref:Transcription factor Iwr1 domain-containing protein n=1 Tax=Orbilia oligospora TaxID=2813651 RepID=A0A7C8QUN4_ORBOL|nr:hypothetical protein TWF191_006404 [Orbilia oligospora]